MGKVSKENGVLKLVRPGGIVELYTQPIKAVHVMERYPRHCVTRPDFFKFPNIVVKPESILKPGQVFYLVPHHTVYRLLKSRGGCRHHECARDPSESITKQNLENMLQMEEIDSSFFHHIPVESISKKKQSNRQVANISMEARRDIIVSSDGVHDSPDALPSGCLPTLRKGGGLAETIKDATTRNSCLKPCLKKNQSKKLRAQQGPRVRFMLPDEKWNADGFSEF